MSDEYWEKKLLKYKTKYDKLENLKGGTNVITTVPLTSLPVDEFPPKIGAFSQDLFEGRDIQPVIGDPDYKNEKGEVETRIRKDILYDIVNNYKLGSLSNNSTDKCISKSNIQYISVMGIKDTIYNPHKKLNVCFNKQQYSLLMDYYIKDNNYNDNDRYTSIWRAIKLSDDVNSFIKKLYEPGVCPYVATNDPPTIQGQPNYKNIIIFLDRLGTTTIDFGFYEINMIELYLVERIKSFEKIQREAADKLQESNAYDFTQVDFKLPTIPIKSFNGGITDEMWNEELVKLPRMYNMNRKIIAIFKSSIIKANYKFLREIAVAQMKKLISKITSSKVIEQDDKDNEKKKIYKNWFSKESSDIIYADMENGTDSYTITANSTGLLEIALNNSEQNEINVSNLAVVKEPMWREIFFRLWNKIKFMCSVGNDPIKDAIYTNSPPTTHWKKKDYFKYFGTNKQLIEMREWDIVANDILVNSDPIKITITDFKRAYQLVDINKL